MRLFDTQQQRQIELKLGPLVTIYSCGITPYDATHLGHLSTFLVYDLIQRRLRDAGHETQLVRNITDIDEPLFKKADELGVHFFDLALIEIQQFQSDMTHLGMLPAHSEPRASEVLSEIRTMIDRLEALGLAYPAGGSVYFDVNAWTAYGELSGHDRDTMIALGAENGGVGDDPHARDPLDFVLWRHSEPGEPSWASRWGDGRPGWHIECSAMVFAEFGETVDIHGGGTDLIFPHHECEAAQSAAVNGAPLARYWIHSPMVRLLDTKMSKSLGNLVFVRDLVQEWTAAEIRLAALSQHYRNDWDWRNELLAHARDRLAAWEQNGSGGSGPLDEVRLALDEDLDTPRALAAIDAAASRGESVAEAAALLGIGIGDVAPDAILARNDVIGAPS